MHQHHPVQRDPTFTCANICWWFAMYSSADYTVTPHGADYGDRAGHRAGILRNNAIITEMARERRITVVDIFDISERAERDRALVASDGLHPSGRQYALWAERIVPAVGALLSRRQ